MRRFKCGLFAGGAAKCAYHLQIVSGSLIGCVKYGLLATVAALIVVSSYGPALADSTLDAIQRLEAKIDALARDNASLRAQINRRETTRAASIASASRTATDQSPSSQTLKNVYAAAPFYKAPPPVALHNWTGCYVGANVGAGENWDAFSYSYEYGKGIGWVAGAQVGCNYQIKQFVIGIEGEFDWSGITNNQSWTYPNEGTSAFNGGVETYGYKAKNVWDATLALRAGFVPWDDLLIYGKVGVAWGSYKLSYDCCNYVPGYSSDYNYSAQATVIGWIVGAGFEYAFMPNWSAKIEYDYINYGTPTFNFTETYSNGSSPFYWSQSVGEYKQIVKVGLNYKFYGRP